MSTKQVIVMRRDLKMRRGKEIAQGSHASMAFVTRRLQKVNPDDRRGGCGPRLYEISLTDDEVAWLETSFAKVTCQIKSEEELITLVEKAKVAGLTTHLVTDAGKTEFNGVPTHTCCAIGPHTSEKFEGITSDLELY